MSGIIFCETFLVKEGESVYNKCSIAYLPKVVAECYMR